MTDDSNIGYETKGLEEFSGRLRGKKGLLRSWVEGRTLVSRSPLSQGGKLTGRMR